MVAPNLLKLIKRRSFLQRVISFPKSQLFENYWAGFMDGIYQVN